MLRASLDSPSLRELIALSVIRHIINRVDILCSDENGARQLAKRVLIFTPSSFGRVARRGAAGFCLRYCESPRTKKVFTGNGLDRTRLCRDAGALAISGEAMIDGEVVVVQEGRTNFSELQAELQRAGRVGLSITRSIFSRRMATYASCRRSNASSSC